MAFILTAWTDAAQMMLRAKGVQVVAAQAKQLIEDGWRIAIIRADTGEIISAHQLAEMARALAQKPAPIREHRV